MSNEPKASAVTPTTALTPSSEVAATSVASLTLLQIEESRRPNPSTVCEVCPASVWMATPKAVKCFCRVMRVITWETHDPNTLTHCDGLQIAQEMQG